MMTSYSLGNIFYVTDDDSHVKLSSIIQGLLQLFPDRLNSLFIITKETGLYLY